MADSIKVADNGDSDSAWESAQTLTRALSFCRIMLVELATLGFDDFANARIDVPVLRTLYQPLSGNTRRSACWLLARVVRDNHPNGRAVAAALKNTRFSVEDTNPFTYEESVSDAIEASARGVYLARYTAQRELFQRLGYAVDGRSWLRMPAEEVIGWAGTTHPAVCEPEAPQPWVGAPTNARSPGPSPTRACSATSSTSGVRTGPSAAGGWPTSVTRSTRTTSP